MDGQTQAWLERLFDETYGRSTRAALRLTGDLAVAEEIAAEALTRACVHAGRLRRHPCPEGWVVRTAINLAIDHVRRHAPPPSTVTYRDQEDIIVLRHALLDALGTLSSRQRQVVTLRYLADLSEADVAATLGVSAGAVKTHLHRGLRALRERWLTTNETSMEAILDA